VGFFPLASKDRPCCVSDSDKGSTSASLLHSASDAPTRAQVGVDEEEGVEEEDDDDRDDDDEDDEEEEEVRALFAPATLEVEVEVEVEEAKAPNKTTSASCRACLVLLLVHGDDKYS
jgi:hypothetical protein